MKYNSICWAALIHIEVFVLNLANIIFVLIWNNTCKISIINYFESNTSLLCIFYDDMKLIFCFVKCCNF